MVTHPMTDQRPRSHTEEHCPRAHRAPQWYVCMFDGRFGVVIVVGILAYNAKSRGFDSRTVQTFVCMNMSVCIESRCFYVWYVFTKKKNIYI
jgi:hypothetical protein